MQPNEEFKYFCLLPINKLKDKKNPPIKKNTSTAKKALDIINPIMSFYILIKLFSFKLVGK